MLGLRLFAAPARHSIRALGLRSESEEVNVAECMKEEAYPYNLPFFRRSHTAISPDGKQVATINKAYEMGMSNPTKGKLKVNDDLEIDNCSPAFLWSDDSRYLAVPQWVSRLFRFGRERLIIIDTQQRAVYLSKPEYLNLIINSFSDSALQMLDSPTWDPREICIPLTTIISSYKRLHYAQLK